MLVHLVADYGVGDLAASEVRSRLSVHLPGADVSYTPVGPFDTIAAGFCVAQLALGGGPPDSLVYHNVAPREDSEDPRHDNDGEPLLAARLANGVRVVGVAAGSTFAFVRDEVEELVEVDVPATRSQFRSRDAFPALLPRLDAGELSAAVRRLDPADLPAVPERVVSYVDGYGNLKTTWPEPPVEPGTPVRVRVGEIELEATVGGGTFAVPSGELSFAPGSSGWTTRTGIELRWCEVLLRGGSAADRFGSPRSGTPVSLTVAGPAGPPRSTSAPGAGPTCCGEDRSSQTSASPSCIGQGSRPHRAPPSVRRPPDADGGS